MIDIDSFVDILYFNAFQKLRLSTYNLSPISFLLMGFTGDSICPLRTVSLHITFGEEPYFKTLTTKFIVVDILSTYNVIFGRPTLNQLKIMLSTYHIVIKFPTRASVEELGAT